MSVTRTSSESGSTGGSGCEPCTEEANTAMSLGRPTVARSELARAISQYAGRVHARLGRQHHLVSPLGAWPSSASAHLWPARAGNPNWATSWELRPGRLLHTRASSSASLTRQWVRPLLCGPAPRS